MKFIIIICTTNNYFRGVRLCEFKLRKIILGVRMHFHHRCLLMAGKDGEMFIRDISRPP